jgi:hypothetical protein
MKHLASPAFWKLYENLPSAIQQVADKNFELLKADPKHLHCILIRRASIGQCELV